MSSAALSVSCCVGPSQSQRRGRGRICPPQAALVEAKPRPVAVPALRGGGDEENSVVRLRESSPRDRADDMQAEVAAMARAANASVYSPELLASKYGSRPIKVVGRAVEIFAGLGSFGLNLWLDQLRGQLDQNQRQRAVHLRNTFTRLGPTFVKIGQGLSTRPDLCPPQYLEELSQLQDALPTFPDAEAFSCIERELGCSIDSIYSSISASPIAAASLGQVYKAQLKYSRQVVAVKVQRPGIEESIGLDFYLIRGLGILINKYVDIITSDVVALIDEFARRVYQELNYVQEGQNARRFKKLYADKEDVLVPDIFWDYTSGKVLTMEWVEGVKLNEQEAIERQGLKVLDLVNTGIQCSLRQLLEYGYFHADPHPGNLLATPDGKLAFLDFGMMSETPEQARSAIIGHVVHMVNRDYEAMARDYYALDFLSPDVDVSPIVPALRNFFDDALNSTVSELNFKTIVDGLGAVLYQYPFNVPAYYALILRSLTVLEGLALYADPNFKVLAASYPYFAKRLLTDPNPYLRDALIELLFKDGRFRWNRLENLLVQGRQDRDFNAKDALQPVLKLLLGPDGEELRDLVIKEAVRVTEAIVVGSVIESYNLVPDLIRTLIFNVNGTGPFVMNSAEQESMLELRAQVLRIWGLLRSSDNFDPSILQPLLQVNGEAFDKAMASIQKNEYMAVLFYASWCPFSSIFKPRFSTLSSMYPQMKNMMVEQSSAMPSILSRYGIHSVPSLLIVNQTTRIRHHGSKDIQSLVTFYKRTTGLNPMVDIAEETPCSKSGVEASRLWDGASLKETFLREPYLVLSLFFVLLRAFLYFFPEIASDVLALWVACIPHLNLGIFGESRHLVGHALQLIGVRRIWSKLKICKTRNFHEGARNARVWASSLASVSLGEASSSRISTSRGFEN